MTKVIFWLVLAIGNFIAGSFLIIISTLNRIQAIIWHESLDYEIQLQSLNVSMIGIIVGLIVFGMGFLSTHTYIKEMIKEKKNE